MYRTDKKSAWVEGRQEQTPLPAGQWRRNLQHPDLQDAGSQHLSHLKHGQTLLLPQPVQEKAAPALETHSPAQAQLELNFPPLVRVRARGGERRAAAGVRGAVETPHHANSHLMCSGQSHASQGHFPSHIQKSSTSSTPHRTDPSPGGRHLAVTRGNEGRAFVPIL